MSTDLWYRPVPKDQPPAETLPYPLKRAIARRYWDHDGTLCGDELEFTAADVPYLEGLADGGVEGARELIGAIREHGAVILWIR